MSTWILWAFNAQGQRRMVGVSHGYGRASWHRANGTGLNPGETAALEEAVELDD